MTVELQRVTTEYVEIEDRIRLSGAVEHGAPVVIWLSQRLLARLIPPLLGWLDGRASDPAHAQLLHGFAQQAAMGALLPQAPVRAATDTSHWLALSIDIGIAEQAVSLSFVGVDGQRARMSLAPQPLRQWLNIVYDAYLKAEWPLALWPAWLHERGGESSVPTTVWH